MEENPLEMAAVEEHLEVDSETVRRQRAATERARSRNLNEAYNRMKDLVSAAGRSRLEILTAANRAKAENRRASTNKCRYWRD